MPEEPPSVREHKEKSPKSVTAAIITMSDTRTIKTDDSGKLIKEMLEGNGHRVVRHTVCKDEPSQLNKELDKLLAMGVDTIIINGGTGISKRDITVETVGLRLEKRIEGFGELFRKLSHEEIGSAAMLSRAMAGICQDAVVFCLPGSPEAVRLSMARLILPELGHVVGLTRK